MDTMRRLFVVLGVLMVVGFLGVEMAREDRSAEIVDAGTGYNPGESGTGGHIGVNQANTVDGQSIKSPSALRVDGNIGGKIVPSQPKATVPNGCAAIREVFFEAPWGGMILATIYPKDGRYYFIRASGLRKNGYLRANGEPTYWDTIDPDGSIHKDGANTGDGYILDNDTSFKNRMKTEYWPIFHDRYTGGLIASLDNGKSFFWVGSSKQLTIPKGTTEITIKIDVNGIRHPTNYLSQEGWSVSLQECN